MTLFVVYSPESESTEHRVLQIVTGEHRDLAHELHGDDIEVLPVHRYVDEYGADRGVNHQSLLEQIEQHLVVVEQLSVRPPAVDEIEDVASVLRVSC